MKILFNTGVFGKHGIEHALSTLIKALPKDHDYVLHQIYEMESRSPLLKDLDLITTAQCSLPLSSFLGSLHMNRKKSWLHKLADSLCISLLHRTVAKKINAQSANIVVDYDLSLLRSSQLIEAPLIGVFHFRPIGFRSGNAQKLRRIGKRLTHYKKLIVLCEEMKEEAIFVWPHLKDKLITLPNAINLEEIILKSQKHFSLPSNVSPKKYFINISRVTPQKNIPLLLKSYALAKSEGCLWPLIIIGDGEKREELITLRNELQLTDSVHFLGYQTNPHPYIQNAGALVMTSTDEGFPVTLLESMTLGCPIISIACPTGPRDILQNGQCGLLLEFTTTNPNQIAQGMLDLYQNSKLRETFSYEGKIAVEQYAANTIAKKFISTLTMVTNNH